MQALPRHAVAPAVRELPRTYWRSGPDDATAASGSFGGGDGMKPAPHATNALDQPRADSS